VFSVLYDDDFMTQVVEHPFDEVPKKYNVKSSFDVDLS